MASKVMTGARAQVFAIDPTTQKSVLIGIFESCTYNMNIGTEPIHVLGRYSPAEITPTSYEAVTLSCSGFRVVDKGPHSSAFVPKLGDLLKYEGITMTVVDRQSTKTILTVGNCIANSYNGNHNSRATSRITINYTGTVMSDESDATGPQSESVGSTPSF